MNLVLIGLPGSGKTTIGGEAARQAGLPFADTDHLIQQEQGRTVKEIFAKEGETAFRKLETAMARRVAALENTIISTGGGVVTRPENVEILRKNGLLLFLDRNPERIVQGMDYSHRPLLQGGAEQLFTLARQRRELYLGAADLILPNNGSPEEAVKRLVRCIRAACDSSYAVIGDPIAHSLSPEIHNLMFAMLGYPHRYRKLAVARGDLPGFMERARAMGLRGFNVTAPHKEAILPHLDEVDAEARLCGAVNTVVERNSRLYGYNTDMEGLRLDIADAGCHYRDSHMVVLGAGGTATGIALKAAREGAASITLLARRPERAEDLRQRVLAAVPQASIHAGSLEPDTLRQSVSACQILINTIPAGGSAALDTSFLAALPEKALVYDVVYSPPRTPLLLEAERLGHKTRNGLGMLIYQALLADELFLDRQIDKRQLFGIVRSALTNQQKAVKPV